MKKIDNLKMVALYYFCLIFTPFLLFSQKCPLIFLGLIFFIYHGYVFQNFCSDIDPKPNNDKMLPYMCKV